MQACKQFKKLQQPEFDVTDSDVCRFYVFRARKAVALSILRRIKNIINISPLRRLLVDVYISIQVHISPIVAIEKVGCMKLKKASRLRRESLEETLVVA